MENTETQEMYLITIDKIRKEKGNARMIDVARERGFTKSTTFAGLKILEKTGMIKIINNNIILTEEGETRVKKLEKKHKLIVKSLLLLGTTEAVAEENADAMEHVLSDEVYELLLKHVSKEMVSALN